MDQPYQTQREARSEPQPGRRLVEEPDRRLAERLRRLGARLRRQAPTHLTPRSVGILVFVVILLLNVVGYGAYWAFSAYTTQKAARADLNRRIADVRTLTPGGKLFTPAGQARARNDLVAIDDDLTQLQSVLPFGSVSAIEPEASAWHMLNLGHDMVGAALAGLNAEQTLSPGLTALMGSVTHSASSRAGRPLTLEDVTHGQQALAEITTDWEAAQAERRAISPSALQSLGDPRLGKLLAEFDQLAPKVTDGLNLASAMLDWSPAALGLTQQFHILLFNMDTDELRSTGGFLGNYAQITLAKGVVTSGIHLHDIYTLDCPNNACQRRALPPGYNWFPLSPGAFGLRDSNLNPDFATSSRLAATLYQQMTGTRIDLVVAITPAIIQDLMRVTGPLSVPQFHVTVTADTLAAQIHYYHQNPSITLQLGIDYQRLGTSPAKAFDVLLSQALMSRLSSFKSSQFSQLGKLLLDAFTTKDIQVYASDAQVEQGLQQVGVAGQVLAPSYDNLMVVDENDGGSYANADMRETASDIVTLNSSGAATHQLTLTYDYLVVRHNYVQQELYDDFVRIVGPGSVANFRVRGPCVLERATQASHAVIGCQLRVARGQKVTLTFTWTVPNAFTPGASSAYQLLIQRQAGARLNMSVTLAPPKGQTLVARAAGLKPPQGGQAGQLVWSATPLLVNTTLAALVKP
ncbi:MAG TPA: DUF4012 domain-containing protein [Ktedonobacterales bacterium]|nr:DUF4012 domain-containing protein [Ktedonobacterales bacterium]